MIPLEKAKQVVLAEREKYELEISELKVTIEELKNPEYDNNPSSKSRANYQIQLAKLIKAKGTLNSLSQESIKEFVRCGVPRSIALQTDLVELGHAERIGKRVKWAA